MSTEQILTDATFKNHTRQGVILVDFWAPWCGPCRAQAPILTEAAEALAGKAAVGKCNVDDSPLTAAGFNIRSIPTLLILKNGQEVQRFVGVQQKSALLAAVERHLAAE